VPLKRIFITAENSNKHHRSTEKPVKSNVPHRILWPKQLNKKVEQRKQQRSRQHEKRPGDSRIQLHLAPWHGPVLHFTPIPLIIFTTSKIVGSR